MADKVGHGGKRKGAGRKPGKEWASKRPPAVRVLSRAAVRELVGTGSDPLLMLIGLGQDTAVPVAIRAQCLIAATAYVHPRLSASIVADATPKDGNVSHSVVLERINAQLARLVLPAPVTIEGEADTSDITRK